MVRAKIPETPATNPYPSWKYLLTNRLQECPHPTSRPAPLINASSAHGPDQWVCDADRGRLGVERPTGAKTTPGTRHVLDPAPYFERNNVSVGARASSGVIRQPRD